MLQRTTISLNQDYLDYLKLLAIQKRKNLSYFVNEAVKIYLLKNNTDFDNKSFFGKLKELKKDLNLNKSQLIKSIQKGRI